MTTNPPTYRVGTPWSRSRIAAALAKYSLHYKAVAFAAAALMGFVNLFSSEEEAAPATVANLTSERDPFSTINCYGDKVY